VSTTERPHLAHWPKRLPRELTIPDTSLWTNVEIAALRYAGKPACIFFGRELGYAELKAQAEAVAGWLQSVGVQAGDRVALYLQNCPQYVAAYYGIVRANAVVVPVNPMNKADEFAHYISDPNTKVVICSADLAGYVATANAAVPAADRLRHVLVTRYTDAMPEGAIDPGLNRRSSSELLTTLTDESAMAAPAISGRSRPRAAIGMPSVL